MDRLKTSGARGRAPFWRETLSSPLLLALLCSPGHGQTAETAGAPAPPATESQLPARPGTLQANGIQTPPPPGKTEDRDAGRLLQYGPFDVHLGAEASLVYNDNIYIQPSAKKSDLIWTAIPELQVGAGDYRQKEESWLTLDSAPSFVLFTEYGANDAIDQDERLQGEWRPADWTFGLDQRYRRLSGAIVEAGDRVDRSLYDTGLTARYDVSPKTSVELDASQAINDYQAGAMSYDVWTESIWADSWATPKIRVGLGATQGFVDVVGSPNQAYQQALARVRYDPNQLLSLRLTLGGERREFQGGEEPRFNGVFSLGLTYRFWQETSLVLEAYRRDETSLMLVGQNYTVTGFSGGLHRRFREKFTASVTGGYDDSAYYQTMPGVEASTPFHYFFVRTGLEWELEGQTAAGIFYEFQANSSAMGNAFQNNLIGINLTCRF